MTHTQPPSGEREHRAVVGDANVARRFTWGQSGLMRRSAADQVMWAVRLIDPQSARHVTVYWCQGVAGRPLGCADIGLC
jgi:hypothetical protein